MYKSTIRDGGFSAPFSIIDGTTRQNINKEFEDLNNTKLCRPQRSIEYHPARAGYTFFSSARETFPE